MARLTLISGGPGGKSFTFQTTATIGRASENNIALLDPRVSNRHAQVYRSGNQFYLVDLQSKNGTKVNGALVRANEAVPLATGDRITIAGYTFLFEAEAVTPAARTAEVSLPSVPRRELESISYWLRFLGVVGLVIGISYCLTCVGILVGWLPIVISVIARQGGNSMRAYLEDQREHDLVQSLSRLRLLLAWLGISSGIVAGLMVLGLIALVIFRIMFIMALLSALGQ